MISKTSGGGGGLARAPTLARKIFSSPSLEI